MKNVGQHRICWNFTEALNTNDEHGKTNTAGIMVEILLYIFYNFNFVEYIIIFLFTEI